MRRRDIIFFAQNQTLRTWFRIVEKRAAVLPGLVLQCLKKVLDPGRIPSIFDATYKIESIACGAGQALREVPAGFRYVEAPFARGLGPC